MMTHPDSRDLPAGGDALPPPNAQQVANLALNLRHCAAEKAMARCGNPDDPRREQTVEWKSALALESQAATIATLHMELATLKQSLSADDTEAPTIGCIGHGNEPRDWCAFCKLATAKKQRDYARDEAVMFAEKVLDTRLERDTASATIATLQRDAERYRFIRRGDKGTYNRILIHSENALDAAIDAAAERGR